MRSKLIIALTGAALLCGGARAADTLPPIYLACDTTLAAHSLNGKPAPQILKHEIATLRISGTEIDRWDPDAGTWDSRCRKSVSRQYGALDAQCTVGGDTIAYKMVGPTKSGGTYTVEATLSLKTLVYSSTMRFSSNRDSEFVTTGPCATTVDPALAYQKGR